MYIARILYPVEVLGPGKRLAIWTCGCPHKCKGCISTDLWEFQSKYIISIENAMKLIKEIEQSDKITGITITGGDPFYQYRDLCGLVSELKIITDDILIYTGYKMDELHAFENKYIEETIANAAVIIDGKYIDELNTGCILKGSENQNIYILNKKYREKYENYLKIPKNKIQNFTIGNSIFSVGIHSRGYSQKVEELIHKKGLKE